MQPDVQILSINSFSQRSSKTATSRKKRSLPDRLRRSIADDAPAPGDRQSEHSVSPGYRYIYDIGMCTLRVLENFVANMQFAVYIFCALTHSLNEVIPSFK